MSKSGVILGAAAFAAVLLFSRKANAAEVLPDEYNTGYDFWWNKDVNWSQSLEPVASVDTGNYSQNLRAFLYMIQRAEHNALDVSSGAAYNTVFGGERFNDLSDHPAITGEWKGKRLTDSMCRNAGFSPGCVSTAAGAYQMIAPTWKRVRTGGKWGAALPDFGPVSQDEAARRLLVERGALGLIESGDIEGAIVRAAPVWASLPGNTAKQSQRTLPEVLTFYDDGLQSG